MLDVANKANILIVDDQPANLVVLEAVLSNEEYNLVPAASGQEALEQIQKHNFSVILLDVRMPGMDGFETATVIRKQNKNHCIPIIFISASFSDPESIRRGYEVGGFEYLVKPFDPEALNKKVAFFVAVHRREQLSQHQLEIERSLHDKQMQKMLLDLESDKEQLQKALAELQVEKDLREKFVATLAHDLRNPITAAKVSGDLIARNPDTVEKNRKIARRLVNSVERADHMIQNLLDANRIRAGEPLPLDFTEANVKEILSDTIADQATVYGDRFKFSGVDVTGVWDKNAVRRILENLISNAVKYGDGDKSVDIQLKEVDSEIQISVHNSGQTLSPRDQKEIFKPYKRMPIAKPGVQPGWGLGLTLVRGLAEAHGGRVQVASRAGAGTTFTVVLPKKSK